MSTLLWAIFALETLARDTDPPDEINRLRGSHPGFSLFLFLFLFAGTRKIKKIVLRLGLILRKWLDSYKDKRYVLFEIVNEKSHFVI